MSSYESQNGEAPIPTADVIQSPRVSRVPDINDYVRIATAQERAAAGVGVGGEVFQRVAMRAVQMQERQRDLEAMETYFTELMEKEKKKNPTLNGNDLMGFLSVCGCYTVCVLFIYTFLIILLWKFT